MTVFYNDYIIGLFMTFTSRDINDIYNYNKDLNYEVYL